MGNKRVITLGMLLLLAFAGMMGRIFQIQVVQAKRYQEMAYNQSMRRNVIHPRRGEVVDRSFVKLVVNADMEVALATEARRRKLNRVAPNGFLAGQVLGNVGRDGYGQLGLEYFFDRELRGTDGWRYARHDVANRYHPGLKDKQKDPVDGLHLVLTLDSRIQSLVELALERGVKNAGAVQGVALVLDPWTGDIVAMANYPFYDPNTRDNADKQAWKNQAVVKVYEPGSTFKAITAAAVLEEGKLRLSDTLDAEGGTYKLGGQTIKDSHAHDRISFKDAMAYSSNICFAKASAKVEPLTFYKYLRSFGFGIKTGVGLPAEESGYLKPVSGWSGRTQGTMAFGHEIAVTPLQVALAYGAFANGGMLMKPRIVKAWLDDKGQVVKEVAPRPVRRVIREETAAQVREMLESVVEYGTAAAIRSERIGLAGKTGTAEKIDPVTGRYIRNKFNSSFAGMVPADRPEYVCLVLLDEPSILKHGGEGAAPIFREIVDRLVAKPEFLLARHLKDPEAEGEEKTRAAAEKGKAEPGYPAPSLVGLSAEEARRLVRGLPLRARFSGEGDMVLSQRPVPGKALAPRDSLAVTLGFARAGGLPDLSNFTLRDALQRLKGLNLRVEYVGNGRVTRQDPPPGTPMKPGQTCILTLGWRS